MNGGTRFDFQIKLLMDNYDFFVQPDLPAVRRIADELVDFDLKEMCCQLIDKVTKEINYNTDNVVWGKREFWQTPAETLMFKTADCADFTFLASSILQRKRIPHRIVFGFLADEMNETERWSAQFNSVGHAWLEIVEDGRWIYVLEFTKPFLFILDGQEEDPYHDTWYWPEVYLEWNG